LAATQCKRLCSSPKIGRRGRNAAMERMFCWPRHHWVLLLGRLGRLATVFAWFRQELTASLLSPFMSSAAALMPGGPRTLSTCSHLTRKRFRPSRCSCRLPGRTCSSHSDFR
jgi:hypothetical protein